MLNDNSNDKEQSSPTEDTNEAYVSQHASKKWLVHRKKLFIIGGAAILVLAITGGVIAATSGSKEKDDGRQNRSQGVDPAANEQGRVPAGTFRDQYANVCKDRPVSLTASPLPLNQLGHIVPLGQMSDGHVTPTDHQYIWPKNTRAADNTHDVVMPAAGTIVEVSAMPSQYVGDRQQQTAAEDHRIVVSHSCQYFSIFIHVHQLSPALKAVTGSLQPNTSKKVNLELAAGDLVGKIGGNGVDWTYLDTTKKLAGFITPKLYAGEPWKIHTVDPISLYTGELKAKLAAASLRSKAPIGGKIDYDIKGALQGNWFREGTNGYVGASLDRYWDGHLSIVPDFIDGTTGILSTGNWNGKAAQYAIKGSFDPASITKANGIVKFEVISLRHILPSGASWTGNETLVKPITVDPNGQLAGTVLVQVQDGEKLKVEQFVGKSAAQVSGFTDAAQTYVR